MDPHRKHWNDQLKALQTALSRTDQHDHAIALFLDVHAMCHAPEVSNAGLYSFDTELWQGLNDDAACTIPPGAEHSIAWIIWHIARIEDITMNLLVAGSPQLFTSQGWQARLHAAACDTANGMTSAEIAQFSARLDIAGLRAYRAAVGCRTREIVSALPKGEFKKKVRPERIQCVLDEGAVLQSEHWLTDYWGGRTIGGLLLMPASRHLLVHLNEAVKLKPKVKGKS